MTITLINPEGLPKVGFHRQVSLATGSKLVFMAGQVAWNADGALVGEGQDWLPVLFDWQPLP